MLGSDDSSQILNRAKRVESWRTCEKPRESMENLAQARVAASYSQVLIQCLSEEGVATPELLRAAGLAQVPAEDWPLEDFLNLLQAASRGDLAPSLGLRLGQRQRVHSFGLLGLLLLSCATLSEALQHVLRFESLVHDLGRSRFELQGGEGRLVWTPTRELEPGVHAFLLDWIFAGLQQVCDWLCGRRMPLRALQLRYPPAHAAAHQAFFRAPLQRAERDAMVFDASLLDWRLPQADPALQPALLQWAEKALAQRQGAPAWTPQVRGLLQRELEKRPSLATVAGQLSLSPRSLQRALQAEGQGFQALLDEVRHQQACDYLRHGRLPLAEVARLLGFRHPSAFSQAFAQWQGCSPRAYRQGGGRS